MFHDIEGFRIWINIVLDIMHDIYEGIGNFLMAHLCHDLISKGLFNVDYLNERKLKASQDISEVARIRPIKYEHIFVEKHLKMSASKTLYFIKYFGILVGHRVNTNDDSWKCYILFRRILDIINSPSVIEEHILELESLISHFPTVYIELYGLLTIKAHNMIHLSRVIRQMGPVVHFSTMRYKSSHRCLKLSSITSANRMNLSKTISSEANCLSLICDS